METGSPDPTRPAEFGPELWQRRRANMLGLPYETIIRTKPFEDDSPSFIQLHLADRGPISEEERQKNNGETKSAATNTSSWSFTSFFHGSKPNDRYPADFTAALEKEVAPYPSFRRLNLPDAVEACVDHWGGGHKNLSD